MEFEKDTTITDEQRVLASTRKITIQPLTSGIVRDETIEPPTIVERHSNVERDSENTTTRESLIYPSRGAETQPSQKKRSHVFNFTIISISLLAGVAVGGGFFIFRSYL